jgi:hypothetical protein
LPAFGNLELTTLLDTTRAKQYDREKGIEVKDLCLREKTSTHDETLLYFAKDDDDETKMFALNCLI